MKNKQKWNHQLFFWILELIKYPEGIKLTIPLIVLRVVLMPIQTLKYKICEGFYEPFTDIYTIEGMRYSGTILRAFAYWDYGTCFKIVKREDGILCIQETGKDGFAKVGTLPKLTPPPGFGNNFKIII